MCDEQTTCINMSSNHELYDTLSEAHVIDDSHRLALWSVFDGRHLDMRRGGATCARSIFSANEIREKKDQSRGLAKIGGEVSAPS